jgi:hypothetical protein
LLSSSWAGCSSGNAVEVFGSNVGRNTGYPDEGLSWFSFVPLGRSRDSMSTSFTAQMFSSKSFIHLSMFPIDSHRTRCQVTHTKWSLSKLRTVPNQTTIVSMDLSLLEKLPVAQSLKIFPTFYGTRRFVTVFTRALHWSLSWARWSSPYHPILSF